MNLNINNQVNHNSFENEDGQTRDSINSVISDKKKVFIIEYCTNCHAH